MKRGKFVGMGRNFSLSIHCFPWSYKVISLLLKSGLARAHAQTRTHTHTQRKYFKMCITKYWKFNELSFYGDCG